MVEILKKLNEPQVFRKALVIVSVICFSYWGYLFFASQMQVCADAIGYESLGKMIYQKGWIEFFKTGPNREPLYPLTIAISMQIGDILSVNYQMVQKVIQIMFLFTTQGLMLLILNRLKICNAIKLLTVLYLGLSPAIVSSTFCLFSEIATYPFVLMAIILCVESFQAIFKLRLRRIIFLSIITSCVFTVLTFAKAIFLYVFISFLLPFACVAIIALFRRNKEVALRSIIYIFVGILIINSCVISYKFMNQRYNGYFEFTDRYLALFYGAAKKRSDPLTARIMLSHIASIPGDGVCRLFFTEKECWYTSFQSAAVYGFPVYADVEKHATQIKEIKSEMIKLSKNEILKQPSQYVLFAFIEAAKMPFWESTKEGFVAIPGWLDKLSDFALFRYGIRLLMAILTYVSLFYSAALIFIKRRLIFNFSEREDGYLLILACMLWFILGYTFLYSLIFIVLRNSFVIASLYLINIAYFLNSKLCKT